MAYTQCLYCIDEVSNNPCDLDRFIRLAEGGEHPEAGEYFHTYYADTWCRNDQGTKAAPGRIHE